MLLGLLRDPRSLAALGWLGATAALFGLALSGLGEHHLATPLHLGALVASGITGWFAVRAAIRAELGLAAILCGALTLRVLAFVAAPATSDDVYRYVWEANVALSGASPYAFAPDDPALAALRERHPWLHERVAHREVAAAYPPLAQLSFVAGTLGARAFASGADRSSDELAVGAMRVLSALWDLLALVPLGILCARRGLPIAAACAWAWSPLVALEFAGAGHFDSLAILAWLAALALAPTRATLAAALLGCAGAVKLLPLAAAPSLGGRRAVLVAAFACALTFAPLLALSGVSTFSGLGTYALSWESTGALFPWIDRTVRAVPYAGLFDPRVAARAAVVLTWLACALWTWRRKLEPVRASFVLIGAFLILSPTQHPWYVAWIVPFLAFEEGLALRWLAAAAPLAYALLPRWRLEGAWVEPQWLWPVVFLPFFALLAFDLRQRRAVGLAR